MDVPMFLVKLLLTSSAYIRVAQAHLVGYGFRLKANDMYLALGENDSVRLDKERAEGLEFSQELDPSGGVTVHLNTGINRLAWDEIRERLALVPIKAKHDSSVKTNFKLISTIGKGLFIQIADGCLAQPDSDENVVLQSCSKGKELLKFQIEPYGSTKTLEDHINEVPLEPASKEAKKKELAKKRLLGSIA